MLKYLKKNTVATHSKFGNYSQDFQKNHGESMSFLLQQDFFSFSLR